MKEPNLSELKFSVGMPKEAVFYGWLIHNPAKDDFLYTFKNTTLVTKTTWGLTPEKAHHFSRLKKAAKTLEQLELNDRAIVVAAFDTGKQIEIIAEHEQDISAETNPFRKPCRD